MRRFKLRNTKGRTKAFLGIGESAATLAAAGIQAAATAAAAAVQAKATAAAAKQQAAAIQSQAEQQADALKLQNENDNRLQENMINIQKQFHEDEQNNFRDLQMTMQMQAGQNNQRELNERSKIQLKKGGKVNRKGLRNNDRAYSLRGSYNVPFEVIDGGSVIPRGLTPEGYELYELAGNDHDHYHKTSRGKYKSGVGIKINGDTIVEGEGNQNTNKGELILSTPEDVLFISKHSIGGFNPAEAVRQGMHPLQAYAIQEGNKRYLGLGSPTVAKYGTRCKAIGGYPSLLSIYSNPTIATNNELLAAINGLQNNTNPYNNNNNNTGSTRGSRTSSIWSSPYMGAAITGLGNLGGALITNIGNNRASRYLSGAYKNAASIMGDAIRNMKTIDTNILEGDAFKAAHAMAALVDPNVNVNPEISNINKTGRALVRAGQSNTLSSAANLSRMGAIADRTAQLRSEAYGRGQQLSKQILEGNAQRITETANQNAQRDTQARVQKTDNLLNLLQYNNDIENYKITEPARLTGEGMINAAQAIATSRQANASAWGNALANTGLGFGNAFSSLYKQQADYRNIMAGATTEAQALEAMRRGDTDEVRRFYKGYSARTDNSAKGITAMLAEYLRTH